MLGLWPDRAKGPNVLSTVVSACDVACPIINHGSHEASGKNTRYAVHGIFADAESVLVHAARSTT